MNLLPLFLGRATTFFTSVTCVLTLLSSHSFAQSVDVQLGAFNGSSGNVPLQSNYGYSYSQQIYTKADLNNIGIIGESEISKIRFHKVSGNLMYANEWTVYLANTTKVAFSSNSDWEISTNLHQVFSGVVSNPSDNSWLELNFSTPFIWDGNSNLVVAVLETEDNYGNLASWSKSDLGTNRAIYYRDDYNLPAISSPPSATSRFNHVNTIQLVATANTECTGAPSNSILNSNLGTSICENEDVLLSIQNSNQLYFLNGITYQWQQFDGTNWNDIAASTSPTLHLDDIQTSGSYQVVVGCSHSGMQTVIPAIALTVHPSPNVAIDNVNAVVCSGTSISLTASGADTYAWTPAASLNANSGTTVQATPATNTTYTVVGTDVNGCKNTASANVQIYASATINELVSPTESCQANVPVEFSIEPNAEVIGGSWEYRFLASDGITVVQPWNATNSYNFIPTMDSIYTVYYQVRNTACTEALDSIAHQIIVGFGFDSLDIEHYNCNNLGATVEIIDAFGQSDVLEIYANNFQSNANLTLNGVANVVDNRLQLTPSQTSATGGATIQIPNFTTGVNNSFSLKFDLTADLPISNYGTEGADGISYSFGDDALSTGMGSGANGKGSKLRLTFDSADNGSENGNTKGIYLVYGWNNGVAFGPNNNETVFYSPNLSAWKGLTDVPVEFVINSNGKASLKVGATTIFNDIAMPASYLTADVANWHHFFSASTGGDAMRHAIDNIEMNAATLSYGLSTVENVAPSTYQVGSTFTDLEPGTYYAWIAKNATSDCKKEIVAFTILDETPVVNLGADTTICSGSSIVLDAENVGSTFVWNTPNTTTQTITVSESGTYSVYVTNADGCIGIGGIHVDVQNAPSAQGITRFGLYPDFVYSVTNPQDAMTYNWNFGDGTTLTNVGSTIAHTYTSSANVTVVATLTNDCGSTPISQSFDDLAIESSSIDALEIAPNPTNGLFTLSIGSSSEAVVTVYSVTGAVLVNDLSFHNHVEFNGREWNKGVYFVVVTCEGLSTTKRLLIQ